VADRFAHLNGVAGLDGAAGAYGFKQAPAEHKGVGSVRTPSSMAVMRDTKGSGVSDACQFVVAVSGWRFSAQLRWLLNPFILIFIPF
jgi:hypothetical protein